MERESNEGTLPKFNPSEVFEILGNETRMNILRGLWEAYDPFGKKQGLSFSELYETVDIKDSGQFNYHLDKLRGVYVEQTEETYRLTPVGLKLVQSVIAGAGRKVEYQPAELDADCRLCGAPIELTYDGIRVYFVCTKCDGHFEGEDYPEGTLWGDTMPAAGVLNRSPEELFATVNFLDWPHKAMLTGGVCPECSGVLDQSIEICEEHHTAGDGPCPECDYSQPVKVTWLCTVCKYHAVGTPTGFIKNHPAVIAFRHDHDIDFAYPYTTSDFEESQTEESIRRKMEYDVSVLSTDPPRLRVSLEYEDDRIEVILDENLEVSSITRSDEIKDS